MDAPFSNIPFTELKSLYNSGIDAILSQEGLTIPVTLMYGSNKPNYCNNCVFDPVTNKSSGQYNSTGANPFPENSICPICFGMGFIATESNETVHMAALFDSKYWMNIDPRVINISEGMVQTICQSSLIKKIKNANEVYFNNISTVRYVRAGDPSYVGLGDTRYIFTMWKRQ